VDPSIRATTRTLIPQNTRQLESQLKCSLCSSVILSHNSRDVILSHNSRNAMCLTPIPSHNSMDTFRTTTQGTPASWPSRYHQSLVDNTHRSKQSFCLYIIAWHCYRAVRRNWLLDRLAGDTCRQSPSASDTTDFQVSPGGTTLTVRHHMLHYSTALIVIAMRYTSSCANIGLVAL